jgi:hypothetical protein
MRNSFMKLN